MEAQPQTPHHIGIVAGWGRFPVEVAAKLAQQGTQLSVVALKGHATPKDFSSYSERVAESGVLKIGAHIRFLRDQGAKHVVLAGKIFKDKIMYQGRGWIDHVPDWTCMKMFWSNFISRTKDARDDTLLQTLVHEYQRQGISIMAIGEAAPDIVIDEGCLTTNHPNRRTRFDIEFGWKIARQMGGLDIGQSITVKDQVVLGVEAIEGTDALIARTAQLCPRGGFTLIKVAKPNQDMRFDVPTIGARTVEQMARAGGSAIAVEAGKTIFVERQKTLDLAKRHRIAIVSLNADQVEASSTD